MELEALIQSFARYGVWGLLIVAFAEASFFPVPPDALLIPLAMVNASMALAYALLTTLSSTAGGLFGRWLGIKVGRGLLTRVVSPKLIHHLERWFTRYGGWAVAFAALTPVPYKAFTIASGVFGVPPGPVLWGSLVGRGARFFFEALVVLFMGEQAQDFLTRYSGPITFLGGAALLGWLLIHWGRRKTNGT
jgi:undecaprenyl-diphosphatase